MVTASQRRFFVLSLLVLGVSIIGLIVSLLAKWPAQFGGAGDPDAVASEFLSRGTATAPPLVPFLVFGIATILAGRPDRWAVLGIGVGTILAAVFTIGSLGEALAAPSPDVPTLALVTGGVIGAGLSLLLFFSGVHALLDRRRTARPS